MSYSITFDKKAKEIIKKAVGDESSAPSQVAGAVIVDALPANGVDGTTYVLRKTVERKPFKGRGLLVINGYSQFQDGDIILICDDKNIREIANEIKNKVNSPEEQGNVQTDFYPFADVITSSEFEQRLAVEQGEDPYFITKEADLPETIQDTFVFQELGEINISKIIGVEFSSRSGGGESESESEEAPTSAILNFAINVSTLSYRTNIEGNTLICEARDVYYDNNQLVKGEWNTDASFNIVTTLTNNALWGEDTYQLQNENDIALIKFTSPQSIYSYSYENYVFDKGIYSAVNGRYQYAFVKLIGFGADLCSFSFMCENKSITSLAELVEYLIEKGFTSDGSFNCELPCIGSYYSSGWNYPIFGLSGYLSFNNGETAEDGVTPYLQVLTIDKQTHEAIRTYKPNSIREFKIKYSN